MALFIVKCKYIKVNNQIIGKVYETIKKSYIKVGMLKQNILDWISQIRILKYLYEFIIWFCFLNIRNP